ncbi:septal ring lytic transglycosylase RlpA family protein [Frankia sp. RB7]|nr:septal ring lytic transglycosylase RlpA family protein [Frankia sp. RB7]
MASWYGFESGSRTANGERFNPHGLTCAHRSLPFGTRLQVSYRGRSVVCRVNDRGPAKWTGRSVDLSLGAARAIGMADAGVGRVTIERTD